MQNIIPDDQLAAIDCWTGLSTNVIERLPAHAAAPQRPAETLDLDRAGLGDWDIRLSAGKWILCGAAGGTLDIGDETGACMRVIRRGIAHLLVGANGHQALTPVIRAAEGGEILLIAPGVYHEHQPFVVDRCVTLQGVDAEGLPIAGSDAANAATVVVRPLGANPAGFSFTAPGIRIHGLKFLGDMPPDVAEFPSVRMFGANGAMKGMYLDIQDALDAAEDGDRIMVPAGRHVGDLYVRAGVTLAGANFGLPGGCSTRIVESTVLGRVVMTAQARSAALDGLVIWGDFVMEPSDLPDRRLSLRNCVIDGRDDDAAISLMRGDESEIVNNLILGGRQAAIRISEGFTGLAVCGNRIETGTGAAGIVVRGGTGGDRLQFLGNTFIEGDYGIFIHADGKLGVRGDSVLVSGNHFGESGGGVPVIAAVHADGPLPAWLESSLGLTLDLNTYHCHADAVGADIVFAPTDRQSVVRLVTFAGGRVPPACGR